MRILRLRVIAICSGSNNYKKAVKASGAEATDIKIYINAAEQAAYYTIDGAGDATNKVDLKTL